MFRVTPATKPFRFAGAALAALGRVVWAQESAPSESQAQPEAVKQELYIREYRVLGSKRLPAIEVEDAVYPYLGPGRTTEDIEQARAALEKAYHTKGFQTVVVDVPPQRGRGGIILLQVNEQQVGRLRVTGSRFYLPSRIKEQIPSLAEGNVPNFNDVAREIVALNQLPDRRITPSLKPGLVPGTVDIDLEVKDTFPLHGSVEFNNRYSPDTTETRLNGSISYNNLWQLGHSAGFSFQISPENLEDVKVFSAYYLARFASLPSLSLLVTGTKQNSNVSTLGGIAVQGRGEILGVRAIVTLPPLKDFYHSFSFGIDYKHFAQVVNFGLSEILTPIDYYPVTASYNATWAGRHTTELATSLTFHFRGMGSDELEFENNRFKADGSFIYLRGELSHTHKLALDAELYGKVQGQVSSQPLVSSEQFSGGGLGTVRGFLEAEVSGDSAVFGSVELRSPSLLGWWDKDAKNHEWRVYGFVDAGVLSLREALPEQQDRFELASVGFGTRLRLADTFNCSIDAGFPLIDQSRTVAGDYLLTFRVWADF